MVCESFWCWSGKNTAYSVVLSWENTLNSHLPRELWISDIFVQLFHSKSPKTPNFNLLKNLHSCSCSFHVKISGNTSLTRRVWRSPGTGSTHAHFHAHLHTLACPSAPKSKSTLWTESESESMPRPLQEEAFETVSCPLQPLFMLLLC